MRDMRLRSGERPPGQGRGHVASLKANPWLSGEAVRVSEPTERCVSWLWSALACYSVGHARAGEHVKSPRRTGPDPGRCHGAGTPPSAGQCAPPGAQTPPAAIILNGARLKTSTHFLPFLSVFSEGHRSPPCGHRSPLCGTAVPRVAPQPPVWHCSPPCGCASSNLSWGTQRLAAQAALVGLLLFLVSRRCLYFQAPP